jgi:hypothetical protein
MVGNTVDYQVNLAAAVVSDELAYEGEKGLGIEVACFESEVELRAVVIDAHSSECSDLATPRLAENVDAPADWPPGAGYRATKREQHFVFEQSHATL